MTAALRLGILCRLWQLVMVWVVLVTLVPPSMSPGHRGDVRAACEDVSSGSRAV